MAKKINILTKEQEAFLELICREPYFVKNFYFTGGTPLAAFYLFHRLSEDIDLFSEEEIDILSIRTFIGAVRKKLKIKQIDYRQYYGLHAFQLYFSRTNILKVDFNYYPFPRIEKGSKYNGLTVDSILDIAVNKVHTIAMKSRARDFIDIYFIIQAEGWTLEKLIMDAKAKFDWHIDPIQLGKQLIKANELKDYPRMFKKINHQEWQDFFLNEAKKLKKQIFKK